MLTRKDFKISHARLLYRKPIRRVGVIVIARQAVFLLDKSLKESSAENARRVRGSGLYDGEITHRRGNVVGKLDGP